MRKNVTVFIGTVILNLLKIFVTNNLQKSDMDELGLERNHSEFFFKGLLLLGRTERLCEKANTLSNR